MYTHLEVQMSRLMMLAVGLCALTASAQMSFDVASVKLAPPPSSGLILQGCRGGPGSSDPGLWTCTNSTLKQLILNNFPVS
jgi:hypothetical protein